MAGTVMGGRKAAIRNKARHGKGFYAEVGKNGNTGGFAQGRLCFCSYSGDVDQAQQCAGFKGGRISRRGPAR